MLVPFAEIHVYNEQILTVDRESSLYNRVWLFVQLTLPTLVLPKLFTLTVSSVLFAMLDFFSNYKLLIANDLFSFLYTIFVSSDCIDKEAKRNF